MRIATHGSWGQRVSTHNNEIIIIIWLVGARRSAMVVVKRNDPLRSLTSGRAAWTGCGAPGWMEREVYCTLQHFRCTIHGVAVAWYDDLSGPACQCLGCHAYHPNFLVHTFPFRAQACSGCLQHAGENPFHLTSLHLSAARSVWWTQLSFQLFVSSKGMVSISLTVSQTWSSSECAWHSLPV